MIEVGVPEHAVFVKVATLIVPDAVPVVAWKLRPLPLLPAVHTPVRGRGDTYVEQILFPLARQSVEPQPLNVTNVLPTTLLAHENTEGPVVL